VQDGRLRAVLDFGCSAVGDPACDLAIAWTYFGDESRDAFRAELAFDAGTWARGRGWALWKALITRAHVVQVGTQTVDAAHRFGWPLSSRATLDQVLAKGGVPRGRRHAPIGSRAAPRRRGAWMQVQGERAEASCRLDHVAELINAELATP
jgi:hypothetical protein